MNANFLSPGIMAIHFADSKLSLGMPLSGVLMISWKTRVAFWVRLISSSRSEADTIVGMQNTDINEMMKRIFLITVLLLLDGYFVHQWLLRSPLTSISRRVCRSG